MAGPVLAGDLPDPHLTPGVINPDVNQSNIQQTICVKGWSRTVRPSQAYISQLKKVQMAEYGYADRSAQYYEEDHLIPLALGGHPRDPRNLWPQPRSSPWNALHKDRLEFALHEAVCNNLLSLDEARRAIQTNWIAAYNKYVINGMCTRTAAQPEPFGTCWNRGAQGASATDNQSSGRKLSAFYLKQRVFENEKFWVAVP
jgi:hypothetical protein